MADNLRMDRNDMSTSLRKKMLQRRQLGRRQFMQRSGAVAALTLVSGIMPTPLLATGAGRGQQGKTFNPHQWATTDAHQQILLPSAKDLPGARVVNTIGYLDAMLASPGFDQEVRAYLLKGVRWTDEYCTENHWPAFLKQTSVRQSKTLTAMAAENWGENYLSMLLSYTLEGLLTDPVYGGNRGGISWQWLQHPPGFPRPPKGKRYYEINGY